MRLVRFAVDHEIRPGLCRPQDNVVIDVKSVGEEMGLDVVTDMRSLLTDRWWRKKMRLIESVAIEEQLGLYDSDAVTLHSPIDNPQKVICVGLNYVEHIKETGTERPDEPMFFSKFSTAIIGPTEVIEWDRNLTSKVDFEVELAIVIGDQARRIDERAVRDHIAGYTVANDVSARDLQASDGQWLRGKSLDTFCPLGPAIVTEDELDDIDNLSLWSAVNGERMQESTTGDLLFGIDELVSACSRAFTLVPGDVLLTGTPPGVGAFRKPPVLLDDGDEITVSVDGIGRLTNRCRIVSPSVQG